MLLIIKIKIKINKRDSITCNCSIIRLSASDFFQYEMKKIPSQDCMVGDAQNKIIEIRS